MYKIFYEKNISHIILVFKNNNSKIKLTLVTIQLLTNVIVVGLR